MSLAIGIPFGVAFRPYTARPAFAPADASFSVDYLQQLMWVENTANRGVVLSVASGSTFARNSVGTYFDSAGVLQTAAIDTRRYESLGLLLEQARTNVVLWNRDLTNAAWTSTNITAVKNVTGIDGVANSASRLTATAGNGTCLQAITLASSARFQTAYLKRITGTGTIQMTMDNGATWTTVTVTSTTAWTRVSIPTQTLANPTVGFRIVTSGDAIAVDYVQNENGTNATSAIATTTVAVARGEDVQTIAVGAWLNTSVGTLINEWQPQAIEAGVEGRILSIDDGGTANRITLVGYGAGAGDIFAQSRVSNAVQSNLNMGTAALAPTTVAFAWQVNNFAASINGGAAAPDLTGTVPTGLTTLRYCGLAGGSIGMNAHVARTTYLPRRAANADLPLLSA